MKRFLLEPYNRTTDASNVLCQTATLYLHVKHITINALKK
jgi:hypothetical protein